MPIRNGIVYCVNHQDTPCEKNNTFNALVTVQKSGASVTFDLGSGVPVVSYICPKCGLVELYAAQKTEFWAKDSPR